MSTIARNKHWINRLPHIFEIDDLMEFCKKYEHIYVFGRGEAQEWLVRFLDMCDVNVEGYVISFTPNEDNFYYRHLQVRNIDELIDIPNIGIVLGIPDYHQGIVVPMLREKGFKNLFTMTEHTRLGIAEQMAPRNKDEMTFEISLADHCNLSCQMCDHYSQLSDEWFVDVEQFRKDMTRMGEIYDHEIGVITFLGGEPTLHPDIIELIKITREQFPNGQLILLTNGVLLLSLEHSDKGNLWEVLKEYNIDVTVTVYPIKLDYEAIERKANEYGIHLKLSSNIHAVDPTKVVKISDKHVMDLEGKVPKAHVVHCLYFNKFNVVKDGRYYMCPVQAHIDIFNKKFNKNLEFAERDYLDIYKVKDWHEFAEFSSWWVPFCRFCDQKNWGPDSEWKASNKTIKEYTL
ncbi:radical SAM protein [Butyrivibrio sp. WCD3002]|uniref:radical SAM protein n=1 Tax=Butyrivibrio sp. WCD3002 TaxID=1280676 RepID=UPI0004081C3C|nr:radical SAM protein [Butyrivibrio sp. WCD3002]